MRACVQRSNITKFTKLKKVSKFVSGSTGGGAVSQKADRCGQEGGGRPKTGRIVWTSFLDDLRNYPLRSHSKITQHLKGVGV